MGVPLHILAQIVCQHQSLLELISLSTTMTLCTDVTAQPHSPWCSHQQNSEVLQYAVHHIFLRQVFELVDEVDHVFAHRRTTDSVDKSPILKPRVLRLPKKEREGRLLTNYMRHRLLLQGHSTTFTQESFIIKCWIRKLLSFQRKTHTHTTCARSLYIHTHTHTHTNNTWTTV